MSWITVSGASKVAPAVEEVLMTGLRKRLNAALEASR